MKNLILLTALILFSSFVFADTIKSTQKTSNIVVTKTTVQTDSTKTSINTLKTNILGDLKPIDYVSCFIFVFIGLFLKWSFQTKNAVKNKNNDTPSKFSFKYWIWDNFLPKLQSLTTDVIIIFLCLRFAYEWFGRYPSMGFALAIGIGFDFFYDFVKSKIPDVVKAKQLVSNNIQQTTDPNAAPNPNQAPPSKIV